MANQISSLLRQIVNGPNHDPFKVFTAQVLTDSECRTTYNQQVGRDTCFDIKNLIIAVKVINDTSGDSQYPINLDINDDIPTIYPYVRLMPGVADGPFNIPAQGSNVYIGFNNWGDVFVMKESAVSYYNNSSMTDDLSESTRSILNASEGTLTLVTANDSTGAAVSGSEIRQEKDQISTYVTDSLTISYLPDGSFIPNALPGTVGAATFLFQNKDSMQFGAGANGSTPYTTLYNQTKDLIQLTKSGGASILLGDKFNVQVGSNHLSVYENNLLAALSSISALLGNIFAGALSTSGGGTFTSSIETLVTSELSDLNTAITNLTSYLDTIIG